MLKPVATSLLVAVLTCCLIGCRDEASLPVEAGTGPNPKLPAAETQVDPHGPGRARSWLA